MQAFHEVELEFLSIAGREGLRDGTTAVVALLEVPPSHLCFARLT